MFSSQSELKRAGEIIRDGGVVVFPTETVYGIGADAFSDSAVLKIFRAKKRPSDNPLIVHVAEVSQIEGLTADFNDNARLIASAFMPGPITIVLKKNEKIPYSVTAGLDTVGIRCPSHEIARQFLRFAGVPVAAPSANISGNVSGTDFEAARNELGGLVDCIIDGGSCSVGIESTVLDLSGAPPVILRPGGVTFEMIKEILPNVILHASLLSGLSLEKLEKPASPGMKYKHYSPKAEVVLIDGDFREISEYFLKNLEKNECLFMFSEFFAEKSEKSENIFDMGSYKNLNEMARLIFSSMRAADSRGFSKIYIPAVLEEGIGFSIMNRLKKAAGGNIVDFPKLTVCGLTADIVDDIYNIEAVSFKIPWSKNAFLDEIKNPNAKYFCLKYADKIIGYIGLWKILDEGHITNIAISPEYRRKGFADFLIKALLEYAREQKLIFVTLEVRKSNHAAINLYKKHGFAEIGIRKNYYENCEDALLYGMNF